MAKRTGAAEAALASYERLVATQPDVERKGATLPYTSLNGHMFSFLTKEGTLALRLPLAARDAFIAKYRAKITVQHGAVMKEYVEVPASLLAKTDELAPHFEASVAYVRSLEPKATTKEPKEPKAKKPAAATKAAKKKPATKKSASSSVKR